MSTRRHRSRLRTVILASPDTLTVGQPGLEPDRIRYILRNPLYNGWIRRHRGASETRRAAATGTAGPVYALVTMAGLGVVLLVVVSFLTASQPMTVLTGVALIGVGLATLGTWVLRVKGAPQSSLLIVAGRAALTVAVVIGFARAVPEVSRALGMT